MSPGHDWESRGWTDPEGESISITFRCRACAVVADFGDGLFTEPDPTAAGPCEGELP